MAVVERANDCVVVERHFGHLEFGIDHHLECATEIRIIFSIFIRTAKNSRIQQYKDTPDSVVAVRSYNSSEHVVASLAAAVECIEAFHDEECAALVSMCVDLPTRSSRRSKGMAKSSFFVRPFSNEKWRRGHTKDEASIDPTTALSYVLKSFAIQTRVFISSNTQSEHTPLESVTSSHITAGRFM